MNNHDGTHVYALDAASGTIKWQNNDLGDSDAPISVQGDLLLYQDRLYLAGGNAASLAVFDIATSKCVGKGTKNRWGRELQLIASLEPESLAVKHRVETFGQPFYSNPSNPVFRWRKEMLEGSKLDLEWKDPVVTTANARLLVRQTQNGWRLVAQSLAGNVLWEQPLPTEPIRWGVAVDADGRIVVVLVDGRVLCLGHSAHQQTPGDGH